MLKKNLEVHTDNFKMGKMIFKNLEAIKENIVHAHLTFVHIKT